MIVNVCFFQIRLVAESCCADDNDGERSEVSAEENESVDFSDSPPACADELLPVHICTDCRAQLQVFGT